MSQIFLQGNLRQILLYKYIMYSLYLVMVKTTTKQRNQHKWWMSIFYFINTSVLAVFTLTLSDSFWFFNSSLELVSWIINSATFSALTSARGLDRGAFLRVFRVGINASSISSWLALGDKHSEKLLIQKSPFLLYYTTYNVTIASLMNLTTFKS